MNKRMYYALLLMLPFIAYGQSLQLDVRDRQQNAVSDVSILNGEGALLGRTDAKGSWSSRAQPRRGLIALEHVGYARHLIDLDTLRTDRLQIILTENMNAVEEVVINTGYQRLPRERTTGAFSVISKERLSEQVASNIMDRLPAIANSYNVLSPRVNRSQLQSIRGLSTMQGPQNPLIVIDDFPYEGDMANINPDDVESVVLLKDAAAASIWGARAGNGVIVITTKKGRLNSPVRIDINSNVTVSPKPDLHALNTISTSDFIDLEMTLFDNRYRFADTARTNRPTFSPVYEVLFDRMNGRISEQQADQLIAAYRQQDVKDQFLEHMYQTGIQQQHHVGASGGGQGIAWNFSAGYMQHEDILAMKDSRLTLKTDQTYSITKNIRLNTGIIYTDRNNLSGKPGFGTLRYGQWSVPPYTQFVDDDGNVVPLYNRRRQFVETAGDGLLMDWRFYPLEDYRHSYRDRSTNDLLGNVGLTAQIMEGLNVQWRAQYQRQQGLLEDMNDEQSYYARDMINEYSQISGGTVTYRVPKGAIFDRRTQNLTSWNMRGQINYDRNIGADHVLNALVGFEMRSTEDLAHSVRYYGYNPDLMTNVQPDLVNRHPLFSSGSLGFIPQGGGQDRTLNNFVSQFANFSYTYLNRYVLTGSARRDASNIFGVATNDKWRPLWSIGMGWELSKENFYNVGALPYLKLRATYGYSGNVDPSRAARSTIAYQAAVSPLTRHQMSMVSSYANPELRWEKVRMLNIGLDFRTVGNRLSGSVEYFDKKSTDLYSNAPVDITHGIGAIITRNAAAMQGRGVDAELNAVIVSDGKFAWQSHLNYSWYEDRILEAHVTQTRSISFVGMGRPLWKDRPFYAVSGYRWGGLNDEGMPQGYLQGELSTDYVNMIGEGFSEEDIVFKGSAIPTMYGSMGHTFSYGDISLNFRLMYAFGHYFMKETVDYAALLSTGMGHADYARRWQQPGDELVTDVPPFLFPVNNNRDQFYRNAEIHALKGGNIRLQYVNLSYNVFSGQSSTRGLVKALSVFCNANNLGYLWIQNREKIDPDRGYLSLPPERTWSIGFRANL